MSPSDTIAAIATPPGVGGIGIIRISGDKALAIGEALTSSKLMERRVHFRKFLDNRGIELDHGLCFYCQAPHTFSGEDVVEIQAHGGQILLDMLLERVCQLGARLARAGEFSERAFLNGRFDLAQAEAIADLIESGSRAAARAAIRSLEGLFSDRVNELAEEIINLRAYIEAALDFAEEEIDFLADASIDQKLGILEKKLDDLLQKAEQGRTLQEGLSVSLAGRPNAGKSSLLNYLAGYEAAIVTEIAGTTRDILREQVSLKGVPIRLNDTAGLRESDNLVEREGIKRAWLEIKKADVVLLLIDASVGICEADEIIMQQFDGINYHLVQSKCDLLLRETIKNPAYTYISTKSGEGMESLIELITGNLADYNQDNQVMTARRRHVEALKHSLDCVLQAKRIFCESKSGELMAEDLRQAQKYLNEITGEFTSDDLLGKIFSSFCIGK